MPPSDLKRFNDIAFLQGIDKQKYLRPLLSDYSEYFARQGLSIDGMDDSDDTNRRLLQVFTRAKEPMPGTLAEALYEIEDEADESGLDRLLAAAQALGVDLELAEDVTPGEAAIQVFLNSQRVFRRAYDKTLFVKVKNFEEYHALKPRRLGVPSRKLLAQLADLLADWFADHRRGRVCEVDAYKEDDEIRFLVSHGRPMNSLGTWDDDRRSRLTFRQQKHDSVVYDNRTGILKLNAQTQGEKDIYRRQFGAVLFGNPNQFPGTNCYTLEPLMKGGVDALVLTDIPGILTARLTETWIFHGGALRHVEKHSSHNLVQTIAQTGHPRIQPTGLVRVAFMIRYASGGRERKLEIRPSNIAIYDRQRDGTATERFLKANRFLVERKIEDDHEADQAEDTAPTLA